MMELRPYQNTFIQKVEAGWKEFKRQLGVAPTGSGKTILFSHLAKRQQGRTLIMAHRDELIDQAIAKLHAATGIIAQKEKAEYQASLFAPVVVASVQTMIRRLEKWPQDHFGLVVCDEAHHSISDSWQKVLAHFNSARILGVTATPDRGDKKNLGEYYENIADEISLVTLIKQGFLCPITIRSVPIQIDLNEVDSIAGDFDSGQLGSVLEPYFDQIAASIVQYAGHRKTLCFLPLIATSKKFVAACNAAGLTAQHIDGESTDRKEILDAYKKSNFQVLCNAMLLTEGYDEPEISCIVNLRPTRSRALYAQIAGRGTRIADGKEDLLLLDFLWQHEKHNICRPACLVAKDEEEAAEMSQLAMDGEGGEDEELDLLDLQSEVQAEREQRLRDKLAALAKRKEKFISAEQFALDHNNLEVAEFQPTMRWHQDSMTVKQAEWIEKAGINPDTVRGKGQASALLNIYFEWKKTQPATEKQKRVMHWKGWRSADGLRGPDQATSEEARTFFASGVMNQ